jgi:hypothetical protein
MTRRQTPAPLDDEPVSGGGLGSMLRGSVNSMVGAASGLNLPLRAVERLTDAMERAASTLERLERASARLDELDEGFLERLDTTLDSLAAMARDVHATRVRVDAIHRELREVQQLLASPRRAAGSTRTSAPRGGSSGGRKR